MFTASHSLPRQPSMELIACVISSINQFSNDAIMLSPDQPHSPSAQRPNLDCVSDHSPKRCGPFLKRGETSKLTSPVKIAIAPIRVTPTKCTFKMDSYHTLRVWTTLTAPGRSPFCSKNGILEVCRRSGLNITILRCFDRLSLFPF